MILHWGGVWTSAVLMLYNCRAFVILPVGWFAGGNQYIPNGTFLPLQLAKLVVDTILQDWRSFGESGRVVCQGDVLE